MRDLLSAVAYIHAQGVIHRDIKFENIKFLRSGVYDKIKILDFGSAITYSLVTREKVHGMAGNPTYASPEMLGGQGYDCKTDVWSCGVIFHYLLTGAFPYDATTEYTITKEVQLKGL